MAKVGLLECDHVREELLPIAGDYREMFPALFSQVLRPVNGPGLGGWAPEVADSLSAVRRALIVSGVRSS